MPSRILVLNGYIITSTTTTTKNKVALSLFSVYLYGKISKSKTASDGKPSIYVRNNILITYFESCFV